MLITITTVLAMNKLTYNVHKINNDETQVKTTDQIKKNSSHTLLSIGYGQIKYRCLLEKKLLSWAKAQIHPQLIIEG